MIVFKYSFNADMKEVFNRLKETWKNKFVEKHIFEKWNNVFQKLAEGPQDETTN